MKKIIWLCLMVTLLFWANIGFADCQSDYNGCMPTCDNLPNQAEKNCVKACQTTLEKCISDGDKKTKTEQCKKSCKWSESCMCKCEWGIALNTNIPFIGRCITKDGNTKDGDSAIAWISSALTQIFMTLIITWGFAMVIRWWVLIAMGQNKEGMAKIKNVVIAFAALGSLGIILRLINPNFFK